MPEIKDPFTPPAVIERARTYELYFIGSDTPVNLGAEIERLNGVLTQCLLALATSARAGLAAAERRDEIAYEARQLLELIEAQGRQVTPQAPNEDVDDENSRDERDQVFGDAMQRLEQAIARVHSRSE